MMPCNNGMNNRHLDEQLKNHFQKYKQAIVLPGARQTGKTTLLKRLFPDAMYIQADEKPVADLLETYSSENYKKIIQNQKQIVIDEIHLISNPGRAVKLIYYQFLDYIGLSLFRQLLFGSRNLY